MDKTTKTKTEICHEGTNSSKKSKHDFREIPLYIWPQFLTNFESDHLHYTLNEDEIYHRVCDRLEGILPSPIDKASTTRVIGTTPVYYNESGWISVIVTGYEIGFRYGNIAKQYAIAYPGDLILFNSEEVNVDFPGKMLYSGIVDDTKVIRRRPLYAVTTLYSFLCQPSIEDDSDECVE